MLPARDLTLATLLAAGQAEQLLIVEQHAAGLIPDGVARPMFPWEVRSGVNFADMSRTLATAQSATASSLDELRDTIVGVLTQAIGHLYDEDQVQAELMRFAQSQPAEVRKAIAASADQIQATLDELYADGADEVVREAIKQGVAPGKALQQGLEASADEFAGEASVAPVSLWSKLLDVAVKAGGARLLGGSEVVDLVAGATIAGTYDLARQATNIVHGLGRKAAADELPAPMSVYSSELLDGDTCDECLLPDTLVTTARGPVRADQITLTDRLLTHRGRWVRPSRIIISSVDEDVVDVRFVARPPDLAAHVGVGPLAGDRAVGPLVPVMPDERGSAGLAGEGAGSPTLGRLAGVAPLDRAGSYRYAAVDALRLTADHPVLVVRENGLMWVDAGKLTAGDALVAQQSVELDGEIVLPDIRLRDSVDLISGGRQVISLSGIGRPPVGVPIAAVDLDHDTTLDEEINEPSADLRLGDVRNRPGFEQHSDVTLDRRFSLTGDIAGHRTEAAIGLGRPPAVRDGAPGADDQNGGPVAFLGAELGLALHAGDDATTPLAPLAVHDLILFEVSAVQRFPYQGRVYDFTIPEDHTFVAAGVVVHNCETIDGYEYISLDEAYADYPDAGPYKDCLGGDRCRGTLLFIYAEDAAIDPVDEG